MKEFQIAFHVKELDEAGAKEWLSRAYRILQSYKDELVSAATKAGEFCEGHVMASPSPSQGEPAKVLQMGPRE